ncbi:unknown [Rickettsia conorii str. Malish 7]|uniref:Uncharacterized protein n=1 Tax=Rickettsia conorii (strain ATCC VR-613 / Malish 7) TaxID=272944 RepID=Q92I06_RICCN|nr:unknown [Rickettsia conorii str. Malish 7]
MLCKISFAIASSRKNKVTLLQFCAAKEARLVPKLPPPYTAIFLNLFMCLFFLCHLQVCRYRCLACLCHSHEGGNPVKPYKNKFLYGFFIKYVTSVSILKLCFWIPASVGMTLSEIALLHSFLKIYYYNG